MTNITQDIRYRLSLIKYAEKYGVTKAAIRYKTNRQYIYRWKRRYDGTIESLRCRSSRPHHHPNQHTPEEIKLIRDVRRRNSHAGLVILWVKLMQKGYKRSITGLYRFLRKQGMLTAKAPNPIECVQTDNGQEFTKRFGAGGSSDKPTIFQVHLAKHGVRHKLIRPFTPRHNGKVERSHRKDNERFYATHTFYSFDDFRNQLKRYNRRDYNHFPMRPLGWKTPQEVLDNFMA